MIRELLNDVAPMMRAATQEKYYMYYGDMLADLGNKDLSRFTRKDFIAWVKILRRRKPNRTTFNDYSKFMNILFNFAYQNKYTSHFIKFPVVDIRRGRTGRVYTPTELKNLVSVMDDTILLQFILSFECFMRLREVLHLEWDRVNLVTGVITLREQDVKTGSKCGVGRDVPLSENALRMLRERKLVSKSRWTFPNPRGTGYTNSNKKTWNNAKRDAGVTGRARWHDLRHTALSYAILVKKLPIAHVSKVAGVSIRTLDKVYLHHDIDQIRFITLSMDVLKIA